MRIKPLSIARAVACVKQIIVGRYFICGTCISSSNENIPDSSQFKLRSQVHHFIHSTYFVIYIKYAKSMIVGITYRNQSLFLRHVVVYNI